MSKWKCQVCGYIYDPELWDSTQNITPETPFDERRTTGFSQYVEPQKACSGE